MKYEINEVTMLSKEVNESTHLCNQQLGHMSDKRLYILISNKLLPNLGSLNLNLCKYYILWKEVWI